MENDLFRNNSDMKLICKNEECSVYQLRNSTGDGTMTSYEVFPGIMLIYSDFHTSYAPPRRGEVSDMLEIHHCKEGRIEWELNSGLCYYLSSGDLAVRGHITESTKCDFPINHYHGLTITISVIQATEAIADLLRTFSIDLNALQIQFSIKDRPFIMRGERSIEHIFSELYNIPYHIRSEYLKVKTLELLVYLKAVDVSTNMEDRPYFYKTQVEKIKAIMELMTSDLENHYTIEELSEQFQISVSALKSCFKGVYGVAIFTFMRKYRMDTAATMLLQTEESITNIAGKVGYSNSGKFAEAFKAVKGYSPTEYRKVKIHLG